MRELMETMAAIASAYLLSDAMNNLLEVSIDLEYCNPFPTNIVVIAHGSINSELPAIDSAPSIDTA